MLKVLNIDSEDLILKSTQFEWNPAYAYSIVKQIDPTTIKLECNISPNSCRDSYLLQVNDIFADVTFTGEVISALFLPVANKEQFDEITRKIKNRQHIYQNNWYIPEILAMFIDVQKTIIKGTTYLVLIFTINRSIYKTPITYWLLTHDIRLTYGKYSKINDADDQHTARDYLNFIHSLRKAEFYHPAKLQLPLLNGVKLNTKRFIIRSPLEYKAIINYILTEVARYTIYKTPFSSPFRGYCEGIFNIAILTNDRICINPIFDSTSDVIRKIYTFLPAQVGDIKK